MMPKYSYLTNALDTLMFANVDESMLSQFKELFQEQRPKPFLDQLSSHFTESTSSLRTFLTHQNSNAKTTCGTFLLKMKHLTEHNIAMLVGATTLAALAFFANPTCYASSYWCWSIGSI